MGNRGWKWQALAVLALVAVACGEVRSRGGSDDDDDGGSSSSSGVGGSDPQLPEIAVDKIDLLLVIDNSRAMGDKQEILKFAVPDLVQGLTNPPCLDGSGNPTAQQPFGPLDSCPDSASKRAFEPILDIHIGVITTSLGDHGADSCDGDDEPSENDNAHLIQRRGTSSGDGSVATWANKGFLAWDPAMTTHNPPGESDISAFISDIDAIVGGAGEVGCGFESQLESWYRFAVDPDPYESIVVENGQAILQGTDQLLLQQRNDFLRPDSLFAIVMLTDENDCSVRDGGLNYFALQRYNPGSTTAYHLPKPRAACATDPNSPCCRSCGEQPGDGCDASSDPCDQNGDGKVDTLPVDQDHISLRCFNQKQRFGIDFLQPIQRYVDGLTRLNVQDRLGNVVPNPLFSRVDSKGEKRDQGLVFLAGIVGVPWQDIARRNTSGQPDLLNGLDGKGQPVGGYQSASELAANKTWDIVLGDPSCYATDPACRPKDPLMIESVEPRSGTNPVTGDAIAPPGSPEGANSINGHEHLIPQRSDLQYACIFDLATPVTCEPGSFCDCDEPGNPNNNPLCDTANPTLQERAKAYPGIRELQLLKAIGDQAIVGSICPEQQTNMSIFNFGYRPTADAIVERLGAEIASR